MSDIFISYSKSDRAKAQLLANALEREGWSVWWDPKIPPGKTFDEVIEQALKAAKCVVVLWSKKSASTEWVRTEASEGRRRGILIPALIEDDVEIPLAFRLIHASRLMDWQGQVDHLEFEELRSAITELLGHPAGSEAGKGHVLAPATRLVAQPQSREIPEDIYLDPETKLMWALEDNGQDINWNAANEYARKLKLGGYSDWRLPTIEELERVYDPEGENEYKIRKPFKLTASCIWSSTKEGSDSAWDFDFYFGKSYLTPLVDSGDGRALCVRRSGE